MTSRDDERVTVCIPVYNGAKTLGLAIDSILRQTYRDFRVLVYDDGSEDESIDVLKQFADSRIRIIKGDRNRGLAYARNALLAHAETPYLAWLDQDDTSNRTRLCQQLRMMKKDPKMAVCGARFRTLPSASSQKMESGPQPWRYCDARNDSTFLQMLSALTNVFSTSTVMVDMKAVNRWGLTFAADLAPSEDYGFWLSLMERGDAGKVLQVLSYESAGGNSWTTESQVSQRLAKTKIRRRSLGSMGLSAPDIETLTSLVDLDGVATERQIYFTQEALVHAFGNYIKFGESVSKKHGLNARRIVSYLLLRAFRYRSVSLLDAQRIARESSISLLGVTSEGLRTFAATW